MDQYDRLCDVVETKIVSLRLLPRSSIGTSSITQKHSIAVTKRDLLLARPQTTDQNLNSTDTISIKNERLSDSGIIELSSDSEEDIPLASKATQSKRGSQPGPAGISLSSLQTSPLGGKVIDLTLETPSLSPVQPVSLGQKPGVSLRLDLSADTLLGSHLVTPYAGQQPPSPVMLAPRTSKILTDSSLASSIFNFPPNIPQPQPEGLPEILSAMATHSQIQHDLIGNGSSVPPLTQPSNPEVVELAMGSNDQMNVDLFGEGVSDDAETSVVNDLLEVEKMFEIPPMETEGDAVPTDPFPEPSAPSGPGEANAPDPSDEFQPSLDSPNVVRPSQATQSSTDNSDQTAAYSSTVDLLQSLSEFPTNYSGSLLDTSGSSSSMLPDFASGLTDATILGSGNNAGDMNPDSLNLGSMELDISSLPLDADLFVSMDEIERNTGALGDG